jgi:hypothetical protein
MLHDAVVNQFREMLIDSNTANAKRRLNDRIAKYWLFDNLSKFLSTIIKEMTM